MNQVQQLPYPQNSLRDYQATIDVLYESLDSKSTKRAISITTSLIIAMLEDLRRRTGEPVIPFHDLGWRNKYNIHLLSGLSQKIIYRENGIIEKLVNRNLIVMKESSSNWGQQKFLYRISDDFIRDWLFIDV